ncbi:MAG: hypothetical protein NTX53_14870 [candidate division WOR-3 bacterium]|nr:hypothetical protein [candidate division WOR-3 bacterium]
MTFPSANRFPVVLPAHCPQQRGGIRNLFDWQYEVMKGCPIRGRNWYAELELKL